MTEKKIHSPSPSRSGEKVPKADEGRISELLPALWPSAQAYFGHAWACVLNSGGRLTEAGERHPTGTGERAPYQSPAISDVRGTVAPFPLSPFRFPSRI